MCVSCPGVHVCLGVPSDTFEHDHGGPNCRENLRLASSSCVTNHRIFPVLVCSYPEKGVSTSEEMENFGSQFPLLPASTSNP